MFLSVDPMFETTGTPYQYSYQNPVKYIDPSGMEGESADDWVKRVVDGKNQYFYDPTVKGKAETEAKYGEGSYWGEGSCFYSVTNGKADGMYMYTFHDDGTYTYSGFLDNFISDPTSSVYDTETFTTSGGSTIIGSKCTDCPTIGPPEATNSIEYQMGNPAGQLAVAGYYGIRTSLETIATEAVLGVVGLGQGLSFKYGTEAVEQAAVHGNSLKSLRPTWGYKLYSNDGTFLKNGITSQLKPEMRYTKGFMSDKYMDGTILFPNRLEAYKWEFQQNTILRGPLNKNMH